MRLFPPVAAAVAVTACLPLAAAHAQTTASAPVPQPRLGLFLSQEDIVRGRRVCETTPQGRRYRADTLKAADAWLARSDEWIRNILPPPGSRFSYGNAGCPSCRKPWAAFGTNVADLDRPLKLLCPHCKVEFDLTRTDGPYADTGEGFVKDGQKYWLRGTWNGFVVHQMWRAVDEGGAAIARLGDAYTLTGDDRYARKAIVILDALATLAPTTNGPRDFVDDPQRDQGRFQLLTSIFFRAQIPLARTLDVLGDHPDLRKPSPTNTAKTVSTWDNIRHGLFEEYLFVPIDTKNGKLSTLHNHEADSVRALVLAGMLFGNPDYLRWGADGVGAFLDNTIDRDGLYYETSLGYASFSRNVFVSMTELLARYDPAKYPASAKMPRREDLRLKGNYFDHPNLARLTLDTPTRIHLMGRLPGYGDASMDQSVYKTPGRPFDPALYVHTLRFARYAADPAIRKRAEQALREQEGAAARRSGLSWWEIFLAGPPPKAAAAADAGATNLPEEKEADLFGQAGVALLRAGEGEHRRGLVMRAGPTMPHGRDDVLGILLYAQGRGLSGNLGYNNTANHLFRGYVTRALAHNLVLVNQDENNQRPYRIGPGGTVHRFYQGPGVAWTEASATPLFAKDGVKDYRRTVFQIDLGPDASYWVDLFDVDGGRTHDYVFHARTPGEKDSFSIDAAASPRPIEGAWTLAGLDPKWRDAPFDQPGRAWGERVTANSMVARLPGVDGDGEPEGVAWFAPPGNAYGFLYDLKAAMTPQPWSATWRWQDEKDGIQETWGLRLTMLPETTQQLLTTTGPNIIGTEKMPFVIARTGAPGGKSGLRTRFAAVMEPFGEKPRVRATEAVRHASGRVAGVRVSAEGGREDWLLDARQVGDVSGAGGVELRGGGIGLVRTFGGKTDALYLSGGTSLASGGGFALEFGKARWTGRVASTDDPGGTFTVSPALPASAAAGGGLLLVENKAYSHGSAYRVARLEQGGVTVVPRRSELTLGRGKVQEAKRGGFVSNAPLVFGYVYGADTRFLNGKRVVSGGQTGTVRGMDDFKTLRVGGGLTPKVGEPFTVYDVQSGDTVTMEATASLTREADGTFVLRSNLPVTVTFPSPAERVGGATTSAAASRVSVTAEELAAGPVRFRLR